MGYLLFLNISGGELLVVMLLVVMLFGADKIARGIGKGIKQVRNAASDIQNEIKDSGKDEELDKFKKRLEEEKKDIEEISGSIKRRLNN